MSIEDTPALLGGPPLFPLGPPPWPPPWPDVQAALAAASADGSWGQYLGPHVCALESELAAAFDSAFALTCASGTLAVEAALRAVGVGPGDEVILAAYEYEANFLTVHALAATPVLIDVHPTNGNLDPSQLAAAVSAKTKAILCSHLHGGLVPMPAVLAVADAHKLAVVEDAAQAPGAIVGGKPAGTWGHVGTLSFGGSKLLTAGRGGALLFRDARPHQRAKLWLSRGVQPWAALSELQAAALRPQLARLDADTRHRWQQVERLGEPPGLARFAVADGDRPAFYKVGFRLDTAVLPRELFVRAMRAEGIAFDAGFKPLHVGRSPSRYRAAGDLSESIQTGERCVKLHHPVLLGSAADAERIVRVADRIYRNADRLRAAFPPS